MAEMVTTKKDLEKQNSELQEVNEQLLAAQDSLEKRLQKMEALVAQKSAEGTYTGPEPVMYHDPFDVGVNPHHVLKHPDGKVLSWKNPNIRNGQRGWRGWVPVTYDDEIGKNIQEYIPDPPAKMSGSATQDNYIRRGTDSILCWLPEEMFKARQQKREMKALRKQVAAQNGRNHALRPGVETFGDGVQQDESSRGGSKPTQLTGHPSHRTMMFDEE
jgi:hypothetical protein